MFKKGFTRGFTLIELLVVIAIIGILAGIVLTSLNSARNKAKDSSAQVSMSAMRSEAELGIDNVGTYILDVCNAMTIGGLGNLINAVNKQVPNPVTCGQNSVSGVRPSAWGAEVTLNNGEIFCVDSTGFAGTVVSASAITGGYNSADVICR